MSVVGGSAEPPWGRSGRWVALPGDRATCAIVLIPRDVGPQKPRSRNTLDPWNGRTGRTRPECAAARGGGCGLPPTSGPRTRRSARADGAFLPCPRRRSRTRVEVPARPARTGAGAREVPWTHHGSSSSTPPARATPPRSPRGWRPVCAPGARRSTASPQRSPPGAAGYDAVVAGDPIHAGHHHPAMVRYLSRHGAASAGGRSASSRSASPRQPPMLPTPSGLRRCWPAWSTGSSCAPT